MNKVKVNGTDMGSASATAASPDAALANSARVPVANSGVGAESSEAPRVKTNALESSGSLWAAAKAERARKMASR